MVLKACQICLYWFNLIFDCRESNNNRFALIANHIWILKDGDQPWLMCQLSCSIERYKKLHTEKIFGRKEQRHRSAVLCRIEIFQKGKTKIKKLKIADFLKVSKRNVQLNFLKKEAPKSETTRKRSCTLCNFSNIGTHLNFLVKNFYSSSALYSSTILLAAPPTELVIDLSSQDNRLTREKY